ncbi:hypothetical protein [Micromonospora zhanjiangensis]|uniref:Uncharacterized protein n=1 Tax=Micromonospora zhanjiangensis TaxID=1522057 RepID=A0ABV8KI28_9ACTN
MQTRREISDLIRATARRDWGSVDQLLAELDRTGWAGGSQMISAAFAIAVSRRFHPGQDVRDIARFVADTRARYRDGTKLSALDMEAMIRAVLGEADLVDDIAPESAFSAQLVILGTLLHDEDFSEPQLEEFIRDVEETAAEYM